MSDPDEYASNINNGAFTLASSNLLLKYANSIKEEHGQPINETWELQSNNTAYPVAASNITIEYVLSILVASWNISLRNTDAIQVRHDE